MPTKESWYMFKENNGRKGTTCKGWRYYFLLDKVNLTKQTNFTDNSDFAMREKTEMLPKAAQCD